MANPILNDKAFGSAATKSGATWAPPEPGVDWNPPISDGPITTWQSAGDRMTVSGTATAAGVLLVLLLISASFGWAAVPSSRRRPVAVVPRDRHDRRHRRFRRRHRGDASSRSSPASSLRSTPSPRATSSGRSRRRTRTSRTASCCKRPRHGRGLRGDALPVRHPHHQGDRPDAPHRDRRHDGDCAALPGLVRDQPVRRQRLVLAGAEPVRHRRSACSSSGWRRSTLRSTSTSSSGAPKPNLPKHMEWVAALGLLVTLVWLYLEMLRLLSKLREH